MTRANTTCNVQSGQFATAIARALTGLICRPIDKIPSVTVAFVNDFPFRRSFRPSEAGMNVLQAALRPSFAHWGAMKTSAAHLNSAQCDDRNTGKAPTVAPPPTALKGILLFVRFTCYLAGQCEITFSLRLLIAVARMPLKIPSSICCVFAAFPGQIDSYVN
jgi:hypothetical protein